MIIAWNIIKIINLNLTNTYSDIFYIKINTIRQ